MESSQIQAVDGKCLSLAGMHKGLIRLNIDARRWSWDATQRTQPTENPHAMFKH